MRQRNEGEYREIDEYRKPSLIGALILAAIGYVLAKNLPDIINVTYASAECELQMIRKQNL